MLMLIVRKILKDGFNKENKFMKKDKYKEEVEFQEWTAVAIILSYHDLFPITF
jgi:hypothetical protein